MAVGDEEFSNKDNVVGGKKNAPSDVLQRDGRIVWLKLRNGHRLLMTGTTGGLQ